MHKSLKFPPQKPFRAWCSLVNILVLDTRDRRFKSYRSDLKTDKSFRFLITVYRVQPIYQKGLQHVLVDCFLKGSKVKAWGISSVGRAFEWHSKGHRFEPGILHNENLKQVLKSKFPAWGIKGGNSWKGGMTPITSANWQSKHTKLCKMLKSVFDNLSTKCGQRVSLRPVQYVLQQLESYKDCQIGS